MSETKPSNIDGRQRVFRLVNGLLLTLVIVLFSRDFILNDRPWWFFFFLYPLHIGAALGFIQAKSSVCVLHSSRGSCHIGAKASAVEDEGLRSLLHLRGRSVARKAFWLATFTTGASAFLVKFL